MPQRPASQFVGPRPARFRRRDGAIEPLERRVLLAAVTLTPGENLEYVLGDVGDFQLAFDGVETGHIYGGSTELPGNGGVVIRLDTGETSGLPQVVDGSSPFDVISAPANDPSPPNGAGQGVIAHFAGAAVNDLTPYEVTQSVSKPFTDGDNFVFVQTTIQNTSAADLTLDYFVAADLFLGGTDEGIGFFDDQVGAVGALSADERYQLRIIADSPVPSHHVAGFFADVWQTIASGGDFDDTVNANAADVGLGVQWSDVVVPFGGSTTISYYISFDEEIASQATDEPPATAGASFADVRDPSAAQQTVSVTWSDEEEIDRTTMGNGDVIVTGPDFFAEGVATGPIGDDGGAAGDGAVCTYTIAAPTGGFRPGVYTVEVARDQVFDVTGKAVPRQVLGTFEVGEQQLAVTPTADAAALAAALVNGDGITITGTPTLSAPPANAGASTAGTFAAPDGALGLTAGGVVLSTGDVRGAGSGGSNLLHGAGKSYGLDATSGQNAILAPLTGTSFNQDVSRLDLTFDVAPGVTEVSFQIVLATQDEQESGSPADAFALLVNGENVAIDSANNDAPLSARSASLRTLSGTSFTGVIAPSGDPVTRVTVPVDPESTGNTLTLILGDADNPTGDTAAYVSAFAGTPPTAPFEFDDAFGGTNGAAVDFVTESLVSVGDKTLAVGYDVPGGGVPRFVLERYDANGGLDQTFGTGGRRITTLGGTGGRAFDVVVAADGSIYVAGDANGDLAVAHYTANGTPDTNFGTNGVASVDLLGADGDVGYALAVDPTTGKIVVAGTAGQLVGGKLARDVAIARFTPAGIPDATFGAGGQGFVVVDAGRDDAAGAVVLTGGGIVVAGNANNRVFVARVNDTGTLDPAFGGGDGIRYLGGTAKTNLLQTTDFTVGLAAQPDGKLLVAASTAGQGGAALVGSDFGLVRLNADGLLDGDTFGLGALASTDFGGTDDADSVLVLPDGRIVVTGTYQIGDIVNTAVAVYEANGDPSTDYALGGRSFFDPADADAALGVSSIGPDGVGPQALHIGELTRRIKAAASDGGATVPSFDEGQSSILRRLVIDEDPPTAAMQPAADVTINGLPNVAVVVDFADAFGVDVSDLAAGNLQIVRAGSPALLISGVSVNISADGTPRRATYTAAAPGGAWDVTDNGAYAVTLLGGQVSDTSNNTVPQAVLGTFNVAIVPPPPIPVATPQPISAPVEGAASVAVQVIYTDDNAIDVSTIDVADLAVAVAGGSPLVVQSVQLDTNTDGSPRTATYTVLAPGGTWDDADAGSYTASLVANQVGDTDVTQKFVPAATLGTFSVGGAELIGSISPSSPTFTDTDADGTTFTVSLKGGAADVFRAGDAIELRLTGTSAAASNLAFKTKGGDGRIKLSGLTADGGMKAVTGKTVDLTGNLTAGGPIGKLTLGNVTGSTMTIGGGSAVALALGQVSNSSIQSASFIKTLKTGPWLDAGGVGDAIVAPAGAGAVTVGGNFEADLIVGSLKSLKVAGALNGSDVRSAGAVGKVTAGSMIDSVLFAGVADNVAALPTALSGFTNPALAIAGVKVSGAFSRSAIAAGTVGKVTLGGASTQEASAFGIAGDRMTGVATTLQPAGTRVALKKLETPDQSLVDGQFTVRVF